MRLKLKKTLLLCAILTFLLSLTGCGEKEELYFEVNKSLMQSYTKDIIEQYYDTTKEEQEYYMSDENEDTLSKTAVSGFKAAETTDHVGHFLSYKTDEDSVTFSNGANGKVLCSQICKYEHRNVKVTVAYKENKKFAIDKQKTYDQIVEVSAKYGMDVSSFIMQAFGNDPTYDLSSVDKFLDSYMAADMKEYPFTPVEVEVSPVYSKGELVGQAGKNTAIGMGVVFAVLIFISFIISLLKFLPLLFDADIKKAKAEAKKAAEEAKKKTQDLIIADSKIDDNSRFGEEETVMLKDPGFDEDLMNDSELVAVITAAIYAASSGSGLRAPAYTASNDKLVVRSIRRARK